MSKISAKIIADSKNEFGNRITSFVIVIPRIVLAEFNTHRMISRNSASSRAIPFEKMLERVKNEPFIPIAFQKNHKGMQGVEYFESEDELFSLTTAWLEARDAAVENAKNLSIGNGEIGTTKQLCNRLLEPYMYHTIICTATEWENFMALRAHPAAEIHIAKVAELMLEAMNNSEPKQLKAGEWHIPFGDQIDQSKIDEVCKVYSHSTLKEQEEANQMIKVDIATARCARVSYLNYEGTDDYEKDLNLTAKLANMGHWSPFEHCAMAMTEDQIEQFKSYQPKNWNKPKRKNMSKAYQNFFIEKKEEGISGNFRGFIQYRKMFENENKSDDRLIKK